MNRSLYEFGAPLSMEADPETWPGKLPSLTDRRKGISFKLGGFISTWVNLA